MNRAIEFVLRCIRAFWEWSQRQRIIRPVVRTLREHWLEAIAVIGLLALVIGVNPSKLADVFRHIDWRFALLMLPVTLAAYTARGIGWWFALRWIGERIGLLRVLAIEFAGQVMVFMPMGDLARVALVRKEHPSGKGGGQIAGSIAFQELLFLTLVGLGVLPRVGSHLDVALLVIVVTLSHIGIFTILLWPPAYRWAVRTVERIRILRRFDKQLRELGPTFRKLFEWRVFIPVLVCNAVAVMLNFVLFFLALRALGAHLGFITAAFLLALSYIVSGLSFIPGGLGAFEGLLTLLMIANGIPAALGAASGLLYRAYNDVLMAGLGAAIGTFVRRDQRKNRNTRTRRSRAAA